MTCNATAVTPPSSRVAMVEHPKNTVTAASVERSDPGKAAERENDPDDAGPGDRTAPCRVSSVPAGALPVTRAGAG